MGAQRIRDHIRRKIERKEHGEHRVSAPPLLDQRRLLFSAIVFPGHTSGRSVERLHVRCPDQLSIAKAAAILRFHCTIIPVKPVNGGLAGYLAPV